MGKNLLLLRRFPRVRDNLVLLLSVDLLTRTKCICFASVAVVSDVSELYMHYTRTRYFVKYFLIFVLSHT